MITYQKIETCI